eukprot:Platyproteum_vivax@DN4281_c0_g1_i2.p1
MDFKVAIQKWKDIGLTETLSELANIQVTLEDRKKESLETRKKLAEETKLFNQLSTDEQLSKQEALIKTYQQEMNSMAKRAAFSEKTFLHLYQLLHDAPDPVTFEEHFDHMQKFESKNDSATVADLKEKLHNSEMKCKKLADEVASLDAEFKTVKNQAVTVRRLEDKLVEMQKTHEETLQASLQQRDADWQSTMEQVRSQEDETRRESQKDLQAASLQVADMKVEVSAKEKELLTANKLHEDMWNARHLEVVALEEDNEKLSNEVLRYKHSESRDVQLAASSQDDLEMIKQTEEEMDKLKEDHCLALNEMQASSEAIQAELRKELETASASLQEAKNRVESAELQLANIQTVETTDTDAGSTDLEKRLLIKQKELENEVLKKEEECRQLVDSNNQLQQKVQQANDQCTDLKSLAASLDAQLMLRLAPAPAHPVVETPLAPSGGSGDEEMPSMIEIVGGQRDRFRVRMLELEQRKA